MRVLGLDLATVTTGYGILETGPRYIETGVLTAPARWDRTTRIVSLGSDIRALIEEFCPDQIAIETAFVKFRNAAIPLAEIRGVVLWLAHEAKVPTFDYAPAEIRAGIGVGGNADKATVARWVTKLLGLRKEPTLDATDALAVGLAHIVRHGV